MVPIDLQPDEPLLILLDLGGVCFESSGITSNCINWDIINQLNNTYGHALNLGEDVFSIFIAEYNKLTGQDLEGHEFLRYVFDTLTFNKRLVEGILKNHEIVIVSDNYRENIDYISRRYHFGDWSKAAYYSFDLKMIKSSYGFFDKLLHIMDINPSACLLIDDSPAKIASAAASGIKGILYQNTDQTLEAMEWIRSGK